MSDVWVLDTETKGTGAHMEPLEKSRRPAGPEQDLALVRLGGPPREPSAPDPPAPLLFKVVDIMSTRVLAEGVGAREAVRALEGLNSVLDARIFVWIEQPGRWRLLTLDESKALWRFRGSLDRLAAADAA